MPHPSLPLRHSLPKNNAYNNSMWTDGHWVQDGIPCHNVCRSCCKGVSCFIYVSKLSMLFLLTVHICKKHSVQGNDILVSWFKVKGFCQHARECFWSWHHKPLAKRQTGHMDPWICRHSRGGIWDCRRWKWDRTAGTSSSWPGRCNRIWAGQDCTNEVKDWLKRSFIPPHNGVK